MSELFLKVINMSISAGWLVLAVLLLRLVMKKAPRWVNVALWGLVAVRLICPFSIESALSLIPSAETISPNIMMDPAPAINTGIPAINSAVNPVISQSFSPSPEASANPLQIWIPVFAVVWLAGVVVLLTYTAVSYWRLRRKLDTAVRFRDNIFQSENVGSPFVLGVVRPRIYLPFHMDGRDMENVVAHELAHIRRRDHWWKPLGFLLLAVHWFNPLMWLAYVLLCRDIELACDEKVIKELDNERRADYTQALLACSVSRRTIAACPLAFGEVGVKERVKSVLNYKHPTFRMIVIAIIVCGVVAVCFLTNPAAASEFAMDCRNVSELDPQKIISRIIEIEKLDKNAGIYANFDYLDLILNSDFDLAYSAAIRFFYYKGQTAHSSQLGISPRDNRFRVTEPAEWEEPDKIFLLHHLLQALKYLPQEEVSKLAPDADQYILTHRESGRPEDYDRAITYTENGAESIDGWFIHLEIQPMWKNPNGGYHGTGDEVIHLFYGPKDPKAALTLDDVAALSRKGYDLSWADFKKYDHVDIGSGLYIWKFEISQMFSLMVGGGSTNGSPMYIYLIANDGLNTRIDIRDGGVEEYVALHKDNPLVVPCTAGYQCSAVGYSGSVYEKMVKLDGSSRQFFEVNPKDLPVVRIDSREELRAFIEELPPYTVFDRSYPDTISFNDAVRAYDDSFFETSTLFLVCACAPMTGVRYNLEYVELSERTLSIDVQQQWPETGGDSLESWLMAVSVPTAQIASAEKVEAHISSEYYRDGEQYQLVEQGVK